MTIYYRGFFRCDCGKMHSYGGMGFGSTCTCGVNLNAHVFHRNARQPDKPEERPNLIKLAEKISAELALRQGKQ